MNLEQIKTALLSGDPSQHVSALLAAQHLDVAALPVLRELVVSTSIPTDGRAWAFSAVALFARK